MFAGEEVEITIRSVVPSAKNFSKGRNSLLEMLKENRQGAPLISPDISIRGFIDDSQCPLLSKMNYFESETLHNRRT